MNYTRSTTRRVLDSNYQLKWAPDGSSSTSRFNRLRIQTGNLHLHFHSSNREFISSKTSLSSLFLNAIQRTARKHRQMILKRHKFTSLASEWINGIKVRVSMSFWICNSKAEKKKKRLIEWINVRAIPNREINWLERLLCGKCDSDDYSSFRRFQSDQLRGLGLLAQPLET